MPISRVTAHAYPWDVLGDPGFVDRVRDTGLGEVTLAATYHATRAATPLHPRHSHVRAPHSALYRRPRPEAWPAATPVPPPASWVAAEDPFGEAAAVLVDAGIRVNAWIVLAHSTILGEQDDALGMVNCLGERYVHAPCPADPRVRAYSRTLTAEALRGVAVSGVSIEACGQLGFTHTGPHEKTDGAYSPAAELLLSICCCTHCAAGWATRGADPERVRAVVAEALAAQRAGTGDPHADAGTLLGDDVAGVVLAVRQDAADAVREGVLAVVAEHPGAPLRTTLHAHPDPWRSGASPALTPAAPGEVDAVLVSAWADTAAADLRRTRELIGTGGPALGAYFTVLAPRAPGDVTGHAEAVVAAGVDELHLYHLGLVGPDRLAVLQDVVRRWSPTG